MPTSMPFRILALPLLLMPVIAQDPTAVPPAAPVPVPVAVPVAAEQPHHIVRVYPRDKDVAIAVVGSRTLTLDDLVQHIDKRHQPGFARALAVAPEIQRLLTSDLIAPWVRHFADLEALRQFVGEDTIAKDKEKLEAAQSTALKHNFEAWLSTYVNDRRTAGNAAELTQDQVNSHLQRFQLHSGLSVELEGFLQWLEPGDYNRAQLRDFFNDNARVFGGQVTIQHILVQHRDAGTGILLTDEGIGRANQRLATIKASLSPDGSNFEEVARARSEDLRTARNGGRLQGLYRYDDRMPAALCRAAWALKDGEVSDVIETQYGFHLIKRLDFNQQVFILFTDDAMPTIKTTMQRARQEDALFAARARARIRLML